jgi:hypothetical protein
MTDPDDRMREGVEHLQTAALELIAAARVFLDLAEDIVRDPSDLVARANAAAAAARTMGGGGRRHHDDRDGDGGVQRIRVV